MDNTRIFFTDLKDEARRVRPSYYFMMRSLLHSRIDTGLLSNRGIEDEDVNVYLAHLLQSFGDAEFLEGAKPYLHRYDHEVFDRLSRSTTQDPFCPQPATGPGSWFPGKSAKSPTS